MFPRGPFDERKHPRGYAGRFTSGSGQSSNAHAMRGMSRPRPPEFKRLHAVSPSVPTRPRGMTIQNGFMPTTVD